MNTIGSIFRTSLAIVTLAAVVSLPCVATAQDFVVFKVNTPLGSGREVGAEVRKNDYFVRIGGGDGVQIGTVLNTYRDKEIESDIGSFKVKTVVFIGRMRAVQVDRDYTICRVTELAENKDPHRSRNAILVGDYVMPVFVVASENLFDKGSSQLRQEAILELQRAAKFIKRYNPIKVRVEGHTDTDGDSGINLDLSQARAQSVKDYLVSQEEIDEDTLIPIGYGESKPLVDDVKGSPSERAAAQAKNRRFEIVIER